MWKVLSELFINKIPTGLNTYISFQPYSGLKRYNQWFKMMRKFKSLFFENGFIQFFVLQQRLSCWILLIISFEDCWRLWKCMRYFLTETATKSGKECYHQRQSSKGSSLCKSYCLILQTIVIIIYKSCLLGEQIWSLYSKDKNDIC